MQVYFLILDCPRIRLRSDAQKRPISEYDGAKPPTRVSRLMSVADACEGVRIPSLQPHSKTAKLRIWCIGAEVPARRCKCDCNCDRRCIDSPHRWICCKSLFCCLFVVQRQIANIRVVCPTHPLLGASGQIQSS
jgi:hypothetical protein